MMISIKLTLLKWLIAPLLIINLIGAGLTYWLAWVPTQIAFDQALADAAWALIPRLKQVRGNIAIDLPQQAEQVLRVDHFDAIYFVVRNQEGKRIAGDTDFPDLILPEKLNDPNSYNGEMRSEPIRIITLKTNVNTVPVFIGVAETLRKRINIRSEIFIGLLLLETLLALVSIIIVWVGVTKGLLPLKQMQTELNSRNHDDLSPLTKDKIASELFPVLNAINGLLNKVQVGTIARQNFIANVAHQLRTPMAGLKMQLEWLLQRYTSEPDTALSARLMIASTDRIIRQTNQLLALARAEPTQFETARLEIIELDKLVEESIQHFVSEANKKNIDLGFDLHSSQVKGDRFLLRDLLDNLLDNAIRYTPFKGTVTVSCYQDKNYSILSVKDSGPGIPPSEKDRIFNRFYRLDDKTIGTGLGLAIVRDIVKDHNAKITLATGPNGVGTIFLVQFPLE